MAETGKKRGPYKKTGQRRREIIQTALETFAEQGYHRASIREIAERTGLSQTGVLHHFGSKTALLSAVLAERDAQDWTPYQGQSSGIRYLPAMRAVMRTNAEVPNLIELFTTLSAEATDAEHPAHDYFAERYTYTRGLAIDAITQAIDEGDIPEWVDPTTAATLLIATMDGLQVQWLYDREVDMDAAMALIVRLFAGRDLPVERPSQPED